MEVGEIPRDRRVEVELTLLHELHDRDVGEKLGNRADAKYRLRPGLTPRRGIHGAESPRPDELLVVDKCNSDDWKPLHAHLALDEALELLGDCSVLTFRVLDILGGGA